MSIMIKQTPLSEQEMVAEAEKALADMASGEVLKVVATDPGSVRDFQAFARQTGNELLKQTSGGDEFVHYLKRR